LETYSRGANGPCTGVGGGDIKNVRTAWGANDIQAANMMDIDIDAIGFWALRSIRRRPRVRREKKILYIRSETEKSKKQKKCPSKKKGPTMGLEPTWV
jgi:hypothetical protein